MYAKDFIRLWPTSRILLLLTHWPGTYMNRTNSSAPFDISLRYLADGETSAIVRPSTGGGDAASEEGNYVMQPVLMRSARAKGTSLDREGFELKTQSSKVANFYDDNAIAAIYEAEIRELVRNATGARSVEIFDHTRRAASINTQRRHGIREPAATIHNDYDGDSGPERLRDFYPEEADALLKNRFAIINVWRSINGPVENFPLAMCDASTVASDDLISVQRIAKDRVGAVQGATYRPAHRWYYFPQMQMDEALLFKVYDSSEDGRARFTIHTSFDDPNASEDAAGRESIETRCFVFF